MCSGGKTTGALGALVNGGNASLIADAVAVAKAADVVVLTMGIDGSIEAEGHDRTATSLPGMQPQLVEAILALKKPTVLVRWPDIVVDCLAWLPPPAEASSGRTFFFSSSFFLGGPATEALSWSPLHITAPTQPPTQSAAPLRT